MSTNQKEILDVFENENPHRDYEIEITCPEFTCLCPKTGQPDFATITIKYVPDVLCLELKAIKLYMGSYRDIGAFHEAVTNKILTDMVEVCSPREMTVIGEYNVRGGIYTTVTVNYKK